MLLTKLSNRQNVHTAGTNLTDADKLSREFSQITNKLCQLQHKTLIILRYNINIMLTLFNSIPINH